MWTKVSHFFHINYIILNYNHNRNEVIISRKKVFHSLL
jgi:hypothetical protein